MVARLAGRSCLPAAVLLPMHDEASRGACWGVLDASIAWMAGRGLLQRQGCQVCFCTLQHLLQEQHSVHEQSRHPGLCAAVLSVCCL
jgi:hypothetical protein